MKSYMPVILISSNISARVLNVHFPKCPPGSSVSVDQVYLVHPDVTVYLSRAQDVQDVCDKVLSCFYWPNFSQLMVDSRVTL